MAVDRDLKLIIVRLILLMACIVLVSGVAPGQFKFRTFRQEQLNEKKIAPKLFKLNFVTQNVAPETAVKIIVEFGNPLVSILDPGDLLNIAIARRGKLLTADLNGAATNAFIKFSVAYKPRVRGDEFYQPRYYLITMSGDTINNGYWIQGGSAGYIISGSNVLEYIYKRRVPLVSTTVLPDTNPWVRLQGMVLGITNTSSGGGWIRYTKANRWYFPQGGPPRCFDAIPKGNKSLSFQGELKNPLLKKYNNHLAGELHALKLALLAEMSGDQGSMVLPSPGLLRNIVYRDTTNGSDPCNGMTIGEVAHFADSALSYCSNFSPADYLAIDNTITRINFAFSGEVLDGTPITKNSLLLYPIERSQEEVPYLHFNPAATISPAVQLSGYVETQPDNFALKQNYPNPFNPNTTIDFSLGAPSVVNLVVYNMLGQEIAKLIDNEEMDGGEQSVDFDATLVPSGVYFYKLSAQETEGTIRFQTIRKMTLIK